MQHRGARRSASPATKAERFFPVRVRVVVPPGGFGMQITEMERWLKAHVGSRNFFSGGGDSGRALGTTYAQHSAFHFLDVETAKAFVDRFGEIAPLAVGVESDRPQ